jgi:hypothetical protein
MKPKKVTIDKEELTDVDHVEFRAWKPPAEKGYPSGQTRALEITIVRNASSSPSVRGFELATVADGRTKYVEGEIELVTSDGKSTYTFELGENDKPVQEVWVLRSGDVALSTQGSKSTFLLANFPKKTEK